MLRKWKRGDKSYPKQENRNKEIRRAEDERAGNGFPVAGQQVPKATKRLQRVCHGATLGHGAPHAVQQPRGTGTTTLGSSGQAPCNSPGGHNTDRMILPLSQKNSAK